MLVLVGCGGLLVADGFEPGGPITVNAPFKHGEVAYHLAGSGAVPVLFAGRGVSGVARRSG
jgi:hypothetical protein